MQTSQVGIQAKVALGGFSTTPTITLAPSAETQEKSLRNGETVNQTFRRVRGFIPRTLRSVAVLCNSLATLARRRKRRTCSTALHEPGEQVFGSWPVGLHAVQGSAIRPRAVRERQAPAPWTRHAAQPAHERTWIQVLADCAPAVSPRHPNRPRQPTCLLYTSPSPRDGLLSRMPSSA